MNRRKLRTWLRAIFILLLILFAASFAACRSTKQVKSYTHTDSVSVVKHDTLRVYQVLRDTLHAHDSIYIKETQKGDTIFLTTYKERTLYKSVLQHDTLYKTRIDTIYKEAATTSVKEKETQKHGNILLIALGCAVVGAAVWGVVRVVQTK